MRHLPFCFASLAAAMLITAACTSSRPPEPKPGDVTLIANTDLTRVSIHANNVSRNKILQDLHDRYGVEVRASDVPDAPVTVSIDNASIDAAVSALLPAGSRYALRLGDREVSLEPTKNAKKRGGKDERRADAPTKGKTPPLDRSKLTVLKAAPERSLAAATPREGDGYKPDPARSLQIAQGTGPKREIARPTEASALRLTFSITDAGQVRLLSTQEVPGELAPQNVVRGPLVYIIRDANGTPLSFGALPDPLEVHSYKEDGTHSDARASEGIFGIWVPLTARQLRETAAGITVEVLDARTATLPTTLDERSLNEVTRASKPLARFSGRDVAARLQGDKAQ